MIHCRLGENCFSYGDGEVAELSPATIGENLATPVSGLSLLSLAPDSRHPLGIG